MSAESEFLAKIHEISRPLRIMHICGTHERTISRYGLRDVLPPEIEVLSGPGCPVCVTPEKEIDRAIALAKAGIILATFGDMMRVPGSSMSLMDARSQGGDIRMVYSIDDAIALARKNPDKKVVFFGIGFETTAPTNAAAVLRKPPANFSLLLSHRIVPPALVELAHEINVDAFIAPGHVCVITGTQIFQQFADMGFPVVVAGFEAKDVLLSILMILQQKVDGHSIVENAYARAVRNEGNLVAQKMMQNAFEIVDAEWRGLGVIEKSALILKPDFAEYDASLIYSDIIEDYLNNISYSNHTASLCKCANILKGVEKPDKCPLFGKKCTPTTPVGSCMVSQEGMCYNWYRYRGV